MVDFAKELWEKNIYHNTTWRGVSCLKIPNDLMVYQELIHWTKPDYIIETGTFEGGTALYMADVCSLVRKGKVITIDTCDQRDSIVKEHPNIEFILGSSTGINTLEQLTKQIGERARCMVVLDSVHSMEYVAKELGLLSPFVGDGCYLIVEDGYFDTTIFDGSFPYNGGPVPAILDFLEKHPEFVIDREIEERYLATFNPSGYLKKGVVPV